MESRLGVIEEQLWAHCQYSVVLIEMVCRGHIVGWCVSGQAGLQSMGSEQLA